MPWNVDALADGLRRIASCARHLAPFRGREVLRTFFANRSARQKNYRLTKQVPDPDGRQITNSWRAWEDTETASPMKGFGVEVWVMRDGRIASGDAALTWRGRPGDECRRSPSLGRPRDSS